MLYFVTSIKANNGLNPVLFLCNTFLIKEILMSHYKTVTKKLYISTLSRIDISISVTACCMRHLPHMVRLYSGCYDICRDYLCYSLCIITQNQGSLQKSCH